MTIQHVLVSPPSSGVTIQHVLVSPPSSGVTNEHVLVSLVCSGVRFVVPIVEAQHVVPLPAYIFPIGLKFDGLKYSLPRLGSQLVIMDSSLLCWRSQLLADSGLCW